MAALGKARGRDSEADPGAPDRRDRGGGRAIGRTVDHEELLASVEPVDVVVTLTHGFAEAPADIVMLTCELAAAGISAAQEGIEVKTRVQSEGVDDYNVAYVTGTDALKYEPTSLEADAGVPTESLADLLGDDERFRRVASGGGALSCAELTRRMLAFARRQPLDPKPVAVNALIATMAASKIREVANAGIGLPDVMPFWFGEPDAVTPEIAEQIRKLQEQAAAQQGQVQ